MPRPEVLIVHNEVKFDKATGDLIDGETRQRLAKWLTSFLEWVEKKP